MLISWLITQLFGHIWEISSRTLLHCYCLDEELERRGRRATSGGPHQADGELQNVVYGFDEVAKSENATQSDRAGFVVSTSASVRDNSVDYI